MPVFSFAEALSETDAVRRHLLIGNGFSISLFPDRFRYDSLLQSADFSAYPEAREAFDLLQTTDFEVVIDALRQAVTLLPLYEDDATAKSRMEEHAVALKGLLVQAIAGRHPERPGDITDDQYRACRRFLAHFGGESRKGSDDLRGHIYSLNYDLLLYWTLLHTTPSAVSMSATGSLRINRQETEEIAHDDGFRSPEDDPGAQYVTWDGEEAHKHHKQNLHYLHGALHLFGPVGEPPSSALFNVRAGFSRCWHTMGFHVATGCLILHLFVDEFGAA